MHWTLRTVLAAAFCVSPPLCVAVLAHADCPEGFGPASPVPNVLWTVGDSLAACPAGDTVAFSHSALHPHPSKLRILVNYQDANCNPRGGVPPESIWVRLTPAAGNAAANDRATNTYADDSTDTNGDARFTISSFSGCGTIRVYLYVSGVPQGNRVVVVRTVDTNADKRVTNADVPACDITYDGLSPVDDATVLGNANQQHWHRNALHGKLVRRTNLCETCAKEAAGTKGEGLIAWSPSHKFVAYTAFVDAGPTDSAACKVFIVPSDPRDGNGLTQFTTTPTPDHDYDPNWSPLNTEISYARNDDIIYRKAVPWIGSPEVQITTSSNCTNGKGDQQAAFSPDGQWIVFTRCNAGGGWSLWKIRTDGTSLINLSTVTSQTTNFYPQWSPDGATIYFQRQVLGTDSWKVYKVPQSGGTIVEVFAPPSNPLYDAVQPQVSPDGAVLVMGLGPRTNGYPRKVVTRTLDPALTVPDTNKTVPNYPDTVFAATGDFPILTPRLSPDGTRTTLGSKQIWTARRNMNLPPKFTQVTSTVEGTRTLQDTVAVVDFTQGASDGVHTITVLASDPEGDLLTYGLAFKQVWMFWDAATRTLTCDPNPSEIGKTFYVKFSVTTVSGGTDAFLAKIRVVNILPGPGGTAARLSSAGIRTGYLGANPVTSGAAFRSPFTLGQESSVAIYDLAGRLVVRLMAPAGSTLEWDGRTNGGQLAPAGVYRYRLSAGRYQVTGQLVILR